jgi:hypothetical protein
MGRLVHAIPITERIGHYTQPHPLASLWASAMVLQSDCDKLMALVRQSIGDPSWLDAHLAETEERNRYMGDEA